MVKRKILFACIASLIVVLVGVAKYTSNNDLSSGKHQEETQKIIDVYDRNFNVKGVTVLEAIKTYADKDLIVAVQAKKSQYPKYYTNNTIGGYTIVRWSPENVIQAPFKIPSYSNKLFFKEYSVNDPNSPDYIDITNTFTGCIGFDSNDNPKIVYLKEQ